MFFYQFFYEEKKMKRKEKERGEIVETEEKEKRDGEIQKKRQTDLNVASEKNFRSSRKKGPSCSSTTSSRCSGSADGLLRRY